MNDLHHLALGWHRDLPEQIKDYFHGRGIPDELIHRHLLGWNGERITIPIPDEHGKIAFFKFMRDPEDPEGPKMYATPGSHASLYGWEAVMKNPPRIVVCEGEVDRLLLEANGFDAVTSTGGAGTFSPAWAPFFRPIREVFICFDRDEAGQEGSLRVGRLLPQSRIVDLPPEVGDAGDVTDFFVRLKKSSADFEALLASAKAVPRYEPPDNLPRVVERRFAPDDRVARLKYEIPIATVVERFVELRPSGFNFSARCPFHTDREPSFIVFPRTNTFHCFGCRAGGDAISFLRLSMSLSFPEALDALEKFLPTQ
jgi:DNA primase